MAGFSGFLCHALQGGLDQVVSHQIQQLNLGQVGFVIAVGGAITDAEKAGHLVKAVVRAADHVESPVVVIVAQGEQAIQGRSQTLLASDNEFISVIFVIKKL